MKIVVEPSGAVPLAAVLEHPEDFAGHRVGLIISGGNVDLEHLPGRPVLVPVPVPPMPFQSLSS